MVDSIQLDIAALYQSFQSPIAELDCGDRCSPYNELGVPFCCDTQHAVPTAYITEWEYLRTNSNLWHLWEGRNREEAMRLSSQAPAGQVLIACLGHKLCQRQFRSLVCRAFPFFPYVTPQGQFVGLTYYWEYEDRCWVINNLQSVSPKYVVEFVATFDEIFELMPQEKEIFRYHSSRMRRSFGQRHRSIPLLHRNGLPRQESIISLPRFGPYKIAAEIPFPDEISRSMKDSG